MKTNHPNQKRATAKMSLLILSFLISGAMRSQCNANFTYTVNNNTVQFQSFSSVGFNKHYWNFGDGSVILINSPASTPSPTHTYLSNGSYMVTHIINDSTMQCGASMIDTIVVGTASCLVPIGFAVNKDSLQPLTWSVFPSYPGNLASVVWNWGDGSSSTSLYPSHTYSAPGMYNICVTVSATCGNTNTYCLNTNIFRSAENSQVVTVNVINTNNTPTGIQLNTNADKIPATLYPNPAGENTLLNISSETISTYRMDLYASDGKLLLSDAIDITPGNTSSELRTGHLQPGLYFISLTNGKAHSTLRLLKE